MQASDEIVSLIKDPEDLGDSTMLWERVADDESESDYFLLRSNAHPDKYLHAFIDAIPEMEKEFNTLIHGFEFRIYSKSFLDERINRQPFFPRSAVVCPAWLGTCYMRFTKLDRHQQIRGKNGNYFNPLSLTLAFLV